MFVNGTPLGAADPRFHTAWVWGQFDVTDEAQRRRPLTVALRFAAGDCPQGPIFLTPRKAEDFPTADPRLNARRWDHMEFIDWALAQTVATTLGHAAERRSRSADQSARLCPKPLGLGHGGSVRRLFAPHRQRSRLAMDRAQAVRLGLRLQDSSEPGSPMSTLRDFRGIWGSLIFMGKNAHDYFLCVHDITGDPAKRAYFEAKAASIKVMGRANVMVSPVAAIREQLRYRNEFARWETWRYGVSPARGGEMVALLNEVTLRKGNLDQFRAIIDEGLPCWDDEMAAALQGYVQRGGILLLNTISGIHTYIERERGPGRRWPASAWVPRRARAGNSRSRPSTRGSAASRATSAPTAATARRPPRLSRPAGPRCWASGPTAPPP